MGPNFDYIDTGSVDMAEWTPSVELPYEISLSTFSNGILMVVCECLGPVKTMRICAKWDLIVIISTQEPEISEN